jgi:glycosyltransferase involved in cell wall biosynthesis
MGQARVAGRVAGSGAWSKLRNGWRRYWNIARALLSARRSDYDFIQVRDGHLSGLMALAVARLVRRPFVYWMSFPAAESRLHRGRAATGVWSILDLLRGSLSQAVLHGLLLSQANHVFVQSARMATDLEKRGVSPCKLTAIPMGIDPGSTRPATVEKPDREQWIGYLGTLGRLRRVDMIVEAFALILRSHPDTRLILAGGADLSGMEFMTRQIAGLGVEDRVLLTGQRTRSEALGYMQACDVCLSPYGPLPILQSTSPTKLVEYMFLAKPVVASEHPEQREIIHASQCGLCVKHEPTAFAEATIELLDNPERCAEMGARGRAYVLQHRNYDKIAADLDRCYRNILSA